MRRLKSADIQISSFENAMTQFDQAAKRMRVDPAWLEIIKQPRRSVIVRLPIQMDDGSFKVFTGYRVQCSMAADLLYDDGCKIIAVSDVRVGIQNKNGINIKKLLPHAKRNRSVVKFPGTKPISSKDLLELDCDILVPAALENVITEDNTPRVKAKIIAEGANGPVVPKADKIPDKKGIFVIPHILCNAGGVTVSYFEWVQDRMGYFWSEEGVNRRLEEIMRRAFASALLVSCAKEVNIRMAPLMLVSKGFRMSLCRERLYVRLIPSQK